VFLTKSGKSTPDTTDAAARARKAGKSARVAAKHAAAAARAAAASAQVAAQTEAHKLTAAAQNAAVAAQNAAQKSTAAAQIAAQKSTEVAQKSQAAAQNASSTAQTTAAGVSKQVQQGVYTGRKWAAPKLESVADYTASTVAPTVSSALRNTAARVRPAEPVSPAKRRMASALTWSLLGAAVVAAAGAVAALVRYRRRAATELDSDMPDGALGDTATDVAGRPAGQTSAVPTQTPTTPKQKPAEPTVPAGKASPNASASQTETITDSSVNGHANTSGW
jgi:hypothetical protein